MAERQTTTRELLEQLASTEYRRSMRADQVFRTLRDEQRGSPKSNKPKRAKD